jgi:hypothetical protein
MGLLGNEIMEKASVVMENAFVVVENREQDAHTIVVENREQDAHTIVVENRERDAHTIYILIFGSSITDYPLPITHYPKLIKS